MKINYNTINLTRKTIIHKIKKRNIINRINKLIKSRTRGITFNKIYKINNKNTKIRIIKSSKK